MPVYLRDTRRHTYGDYLIWSRDYGDELIDGAAYIREPSSPSCRHQEFVGELYRQIANTLEGKPCRAYAAPLDVRLPKDGEADDQVDTVVQPDVFIVCDGHKRDERGVRGAPDWLAEVLSHTTASYDRGVKLAAYERAGVPEVWLIHPTELTVTIHRLQGGHYGRASILDLKGQTRLSAVSGVSIDWDHLLANIA